MPWMSHAWMGPSSDCIGLQAPISLQTRKDRARSRVFEDLIGGPRGSLWLITGVRVFFIGVLGYWALGCAGIVCVDREETVYHTKKLYITRRAWRWRKAGKCARHGRK